MELYEIQSHVNKLSNETSQLACYAAVNVLLAPTGAKAVEKKVSRRLIQAAEFSPTSFISRGSTLLSHAALSM